MWGLLAPTPPARATAPDALKRITLPLTEESANHSISRVQGGVPPWRGLGQRPKYLTPITPTRRVPWLRQEWIRCSSAGIRCTIRSRSAGCCTSRLTTGYSVCWTSILWSGTSVRASGISGAGSMSCTTSISARAWWICFTTICSASLPPGSSALLPTTSSGCSSGTTAISGAMISRSSCSNSSAWPPFSGIRAFWWISTRPVFPPGRRRSRPDSIPTSPLIRPWTFWTGATNATQEAGRFWPI